MEISLGLICLTLEKAKGMEKASLNEVQSNSCWAFKAMNEALLFIIQYFIAPKL